MVIAQGRRIPVSMLQRQDSGGAESVRDGVLKTELWRPDGDQLWSTEGKEGSGMISRTCLISVVRISGWIFDPVS